MHNWKWHGLLKLQAIFNFLVSLGSNSPDDVYILEIPHLAVDDIFTLKYWADSLPTITPKIILGCLSGLDFLSIL